MVHESPKKQRAEFPQNVSIKIYKIRNITLRILSFSLCSKFINLGFSHVMLKFHIKLMIFILETCAINKKYNANNVNNFKTTINTMKMLLITLKCLQILQCLELRFLLVELQLNSKYKSVFIYRYIVLILYTCGRL